ncbi:phosphate signaling complex protein PhoU [Brevibacterium litoralis]|uniref:phosphate signaling complex protein PhoU n=1 Tax=Brevibacterium litoralis TaxID=3138935 RepID=UPI0032ED49F9
MREVFKNELDAISTDLIALAKKVLEAVDNANNALLDNDLDRAEKVIDGDSVIDMLVAEIDREAARFIARQAPVAVDLRVVIAALKMSVAMERMGDLARHIASQVRIRHPHEAIPAGFVDVFSSFARSAHRIAVAMVQLLENPGLGAVPMISNIDQELDQLHLRVFSLIAEADMTVVTPSQIADVTLLARYFERFGDQAVNVSQKVEYLLTGSFEPELSAKDDGTPDVAPEG